MTPEKFAELLCKIREEYETSWDGHKHTKNYHELSKQHSPEWSPIIDCLFTVGHHDMWDWCAQALEYVQQARDGLITKDEMANKIEALFAVKFETAV
jgi:hypothetical protein